MQEIARVRIIIALLRQEVADQKVHPMKHSLEEQMIKSNHILLASAGWLCHLRQKFDRRVLRLLFLCGWRS
ncbi:MAG: hypothetical protein FD147_2172 [Chloroflexi bacterium]|nr:MAG: hypothetical protein FD147_2172 [Chloroflexota bacterium]